MASRFTKGLFLLGKNWYDYKTKSNIRDTAEEEKIKELWKTAAREKDEDALRDASLRLANLRAAGEKQRQGIVGVEAEREAEMFPLKKEDVQLGVKTAAQQLKERLEDANWMKKKREREETKLWPQEDISADLRAEKGRVDIRTARQKLEDLKYYNKNILPIEKEKLWLQTEIDKRANDVAPLQNMHDLLSKQIYSLIQGGYEVPQNLYIELNNVKDRIETLTVGKPARKVTVPSVTYDMPLLGEITIGTDVNPFHKQFKIAAKTHGYDPDVVTAIVQKYAKQYDLPAQLIWAVIKQESAFNPTAVSPKGAYGFMQLMPATARGLKVDRKIMLENIEGGAKLLRELLTRYDGDLARTLSAYNAGPDAVARASSPDGVPNIKETKNYVNRIMSSLGLNRGDKVAVLQKVPEPQPMTKRTNNNLKLLNPIVEKVVTGKMEPEMAIKLLEAKGIMDDDIYEYIWHSWYTSPVSEDEQLKRDAYEMIMIQKSKQKKPKTRTGTSPVKGVVIK
ncbi:MAG: hypothetical protein DRJ03_02755 [Chloroflexi bacterium]|nr:MAG: hypothetical protein DRJ03_02755 [Chloroflexota bacterium]